MNKVYMREITATLFFFNLLQASFQRLADLVACTLPNTPAAVFIKLTRSRNFYSWINQGIRDINHKIGQDHEYPVENRSTHDEGVITVGNGSYKMFTHSRDCKHLLNNE